MTAKKLIQLVVLKVRLFPVAQASRPCFDRRPKDPAQHHNGLGCA